MVTCRVVFRYADILWSWSKPVSSLDWRDIKSDSTWGQSSRTNDVQITQQSGDRLLSWTLAVGDGLTSISTPRCRQNYYCLLLYVIFKTCLSVVMHVGIPHIRGSLNDMRYINSRFTYLLIIQRARFLPHWRPQRSFGSRVDRASSNILMCNREMAALTHLLSSTLRLWPFLAVLVNVVLFRNETIARASTFHHALPTLVLTIWLQNFAPINHSSLYVRRHRNG